MSEVHDDGAAASEDRGGSLEEQRKLRQAKVDALRASGTDPYPDRFDRSALSGELHRRFAHLEPGGETDVVERVAGRVMLVRRMGKLQFLTLQDAAGTIQLFVSKAVTGDAAFAAVAELDIGDWVGAEGTVIATKTGELSIKASSAVLLAKALRPLPDKWHGLSDTDTRYRQRYVDLIVNEEARRTFTIRHSAVKAVRETLDAEGFVEVETPVLQLEAGGATARPFETHHNALDQEMFLRIATELHLKRLVVGGIEKVYEVGRIFRNEGISTRHNPEFTMVEVYWALANYDDMIGLTERIICAAAQRALGSLVAGTAEDPVDLTPPWPRAHLVDLIAEHTGARLDVTDDVADLRAELDRLGVAWEPHWGPGALLYEVYDQLVEHRLAGPVFVVGYPTEVSPLAKPNPANPLMTDRFELIVRGRELANGYSELNDPVRQRAAFEAQVARAQQGDAEATRTVDEDYLRALEFALPPTGGLGVGIDRLVMLLAGVASIREVILFPTLRPEH
jgi:lysyl-tRNA synthetase class 2